MKKKFAIISLLTFGMVLPLTGCGKISEEPAAGVSIENAEGQTLGFTYLYDLGNGYKLYADNFTKIVYLRYDYEGGKGATSVGSSSITPYLSKDGNYYKVNTQTRVIEEYIPNHTVTNSTETTETTEATTQEGQQSTSQKQDIEAILNENGQKNQNSNNKQKQETESQIQSQNPNDNTTEVSQNIDGAISTTIENTEPIEDENAEVIENEKTETNKQE